MTEFERGIRFVLERHETYTKGDGPVVTQFGDYQLTMIESPAAKLLKGSAEHRERRVQAMLALAKMTTATEERAHPEVL